MASIQSKMSRGHKYWYIVESRRVNGKPRPIVLEYLGKAETLLKRLRQGSGGKLKIKSHSHGAVAALLEVARKLDVVSIINRHIQSRRPYWPDKPLRNNLTAGITLLLAALGRVCMPTSKRGWWNWARTASCEYLLRVGLSKVDSQHFWDLMDCLPDDAIEKIELELLRNLQTMPARCVTTPRIFTLLWTRPTRVATLRSAARTNRNAMICGRLDWPWWLRAKISSRFFTTPTRAT